MADIFDKAKRSEIMAKVKGAGNAATELRMIALFKAHGIKGWRRHSTVFGKPDFVFFEARVAIFVDGEFWHGHPTRAKIPDSNRDFWLKKIRANKARDRKVNRTLRGRGWTVVRVWQRDIAKPATKRRILTALGKRIAT